MEKASQELRHEHEAILFTLKVLGEICGRMQSNHQVSLEDMKGIVDFLMIFADKCHHGKEEGILFPALEEAGIPRENGPIGVMLLEHAQGREYVVKMKEAIAGDTVRKKEFLNAAGDYIELLRGHIARENDVLFPLGDARLSGAKQKELLDAFEEFEEKVIGRGKHEELHRMLDGFENKYRT